MPSDPRSYPGTLPQSVTDPRAHAAYQSIAYHQQRSSSPQAFYQQWAPYARMAGQALGVDPNIILSQWANESGFGRSEVARQGNLGGIKDARGRYESYRTPQQFVEAYVNRIRTSFPDAMGAGSDANRFAQGLVRGRAGSYFGEHPGPRDIANYVQGLRIYPTTTAGAPRPQAAAGSAGQQGQNQWLTPRFQQPGLDWQHETPALRHRVSDMLRAMPENLRRTVELTSGFRTARGEEHLREQYRRGVPGVYKPAAGTSPHERGWAADLKGSPEAMRWLHQNAPRYGLSFPDPGGDPVHVVLAEHAPGGPRPVPPQYAAAGADRPQVVAGPQAQPPTPLTPQPAQQPGRQPPAGGPGQQPPTPPQPGQQPPEAGPGQRPPWPQRARELPPQPPAPWQTGPWNWGVQPPPMPGYFPSVGGPVPPGQGVQPMPPPAGKPTELLPHPTAAPRHAPRHRLPPSGRPVQPSLPPESFGVPSVPPRYTAVEPPPPTTQQAGEATTDPMSGAPMVAPPTQTPPWQLPPPVGIEPGSQFSGIPGPGGQDVPTPLTNIPQQQPPPSSIGPPFTNIPTPQPIDVTVLATEPDPSGKNFTVPPNTNVPDYLANEGGVGGATSQPIPRPADSDGGPTLQTGLPRQDAPIPDAAQPETPQPETTQPDAAKPAEAPQIPQLPPLPDRGKDSGQQQQPPPQPAAPPPPIQPLPQISVGGGDLSLQPTSAATPDFPAAAGTGLQGSQPSIAPLIETPGPQIGVDPNAAYPPSMTGAGGGPGAATRGPMAGPPDATPPPQPQPIPAAAPTPEASPTGGPGAAPRVPPLQPAPGAGASAPAGGLEPPAGGDVPPAEGPDLGGGGGGPAAPPLAPGAPSGQLVRGGRADTLKQAPGYPTYGPDGPDYGFGPGQVPATSGNEFFDPAAPLRVNFDMTVAGAHFRREMLKSGDLQRDVIKKQDEILQREDPERAAWRAAIVARMAAYEELVRQEALLAKNPPQRGTNDVAQAVAATTQALAMLGGSFSSMPATVSLNVLGDVMAAARTRNDQQFRNAMEMWKSSADMTYRAAQMEINGINLALKMYGGDPRNAVTKTSDELQRLAIRFGNQNLYQDAISGNFERIMKSVGLQKDTFLAWQANTLAAQEMFLFQHTNNEELDAAAAKLSPAERAANLALDPEGRGVAPSEHFKIWTKNYETARLAGVPGFGAEKGAGAAAVKGKVGVYTWTDLEGKKHVAEAQQIPGVGLADMENNPIPHVQYSDRQISAAAQQELEPYSGPATGWQGWPNAPPPSDKDITPAVWSQALLLAGQGKPVPMGRSVPEAAAIRKAYPLAQLALGIDPASGARYAIDFKEREAMAVGVAHGFANGWQSKNLASLNQLAGHISVFRDYVNALNSGQYPAINIARQALERALGKPNITSYDIAKTLMSDEVIRLLTTTGGTHEDRAGLQAELAPFLAKKQQEGGADVLVNMVRERFEGLRTNWDAPAGMDEAEHAKRDKYFTDVLMQGRAREMFVTDPKEIPPATGRPGWARGEPAYDKDSKEVWQGSDGKWYYPDHTPYKQP